MHGMIDSPSVRNNERQHLRTTCPDQLREHRQVSPSLSSCEQVGDGTTSLPKSERRDKGKECVRSALDLPFSFYQ